ncbi:MAG: carbonic anhydrase [Bdellovibrionota bacterium]
MARRDSLKLLAGFRKFREKYFDVDHSIYKDQLVGGQTPKTLIIGCSDSRVDPAIITTAEPGEIFVVRNVANLVPPYDLTGGFHGVSAAIEFAVTDLKVETVIILGHRQCGGIRALMLNQQRPAGFVNQWMSIALDAKRRVLAKHKNADPDTLCRHGEMESIVVSLRNLRTFPFVQEAIRDRNLSIMGIYFDLERGELCEFDEEDGAFKSLEV